MLQILRQAWRTMRRDPVLLTLLVLAAAYFLLYYITDPVRPTGMFQILGFKDSIGYPDGWFGYYDQSQYLRLSHTLADFNFSQLHTTYNYGLGYPLVAVPALWLGFSRDPFVFFNLFAFVFAAFAVYHVAKKLISPFAGFVAGFGLVFATPLIHYVDQPWNSTVCLVVMSVILLTLTVRKITKWHFLIIGLMLGWAFAARYVDIVWLGPLALVSLYRGSIQTLVKSLAPMIIGLSLVILPVLYSHQKIFGSPFRTPYVNHLGLDGAGGSDQGLQAYSLKRVPRAGLALFVSPRLAGSPDGDRGLFIDMFWALAAIPGAIILFKGRKHRLFAVSFVAALAVASLFYLSFRASTIGSLKYGELHYFKMFWPGLVIIAAVFFDRQFKRLKQPKS